jgi:hypothetical protein
MSLSKSKCWYSNNCLQFLKHAVPFKDVKCFVGLVQDSFFCFILTLVLFISLEGKEVLEGEECATDPWRLNGNDSSTIQLLF